MRNPGLGATGRGTGIYPVDNPDLIVIDFHSPDQPADDLPPGRPVGVFEARLDPVGKGLEMSNHQSQFSFKESLGSELEW